MSSKGIGVVWKSVAGIEIEPRFHVRRQEFFVVGCCGNLGEWNIRTGLLAVEHSALLEDYVIRATLQQMRCYAYQLGLGFLGGSEDG